jgi:hypothetical protein
MHPYLFIICIQRIVVSNTEQKLTGGGLVGKKFQSALNLTGSLNIYILLLRFYYPVILFRVI